MKNAVKISFALILIAFAIGIYLYPSMPEQMASHWNTKGEVDDYLPKFWGLFLMPIIALACLLLFAVLPRIDPLRNNILKFIKYYEWFIIIFTAFLFYVYLLTIGWHLDYRFDMGAMLAPAIGILFIYIGVMTENAKRNWFIGIRTPWTLSNENVWKKTHKLGGKMFKAAGVIALFGLVFPDYSVWLILVPVLSAALVSVVYSYFEYQKEIKKKKKIKK